VDGNGDENGDPERDTDRPRGRGPVRVAGFDGVGSGADDGVSDDERPATRVAGFDGLDAAPARPAQVVDFADLVAKREDRRSRRSADRVVEDGRPDARSAGTRPTGTRSADARSAGTRSADARSAGTRSADARSADAPSAVPATRRPAAPPANPLPAADPVPPDRPLPRGRRRGARVGRLGPDTPDPGRGDTDRDTGPAPDADPVTVAREICLRLLTDRARTRQELAQALARKGVPAEAAAEVLDRFDEVGLIDDAAFAGQWVRSRHTHRGLGRRAIAVELRRKGVADDVAGEALAEVDTAAEARRARELVDRKLRSLAVGTAEQRASAARRLVGMLARKGYGAGVAYGVVREALADHGADTEELGADEPSDE
jgi:regulatory protein